MCVFASACVHACQDCASHKTDAGVTVNNSQSAVPSLQRTERLAERKRYREGESEILKADHKSNING